LGRRIHFLTPFILLVTQLSIAQPQVNEAQVTEDASATLTAAGKKLMSRFKKFDSIQGEAAYSIALCADIPDNNNPDRVHVKDETGHVFIVLTKIAGIDTVDVVFGFYPRRPASSILFKNVRCEILDNGNRKYDVHIKKDINAEEFDLMIDKSVELTGKKYNLNKYNCYDYALELVNALPGVEKLVPRHIKFPFIFGRGGSPCGLYRDLEKIKNSESSWTPYINFGDFRAPKSGKR
jgi:hypothetical protein